MKLLKVSILLNGIENFEDRRIIRGLETKVVIENEVQDNEKDNIVKVLKNIDVIQIEKEDIVQKKDVQVIINFEEVLKKIIGKNRGIKL